MEKDIRELLEQLDMAGIEQIPVDRRYWFLRTEGGLYYKEFFHNNFIAIGYNEIDGESLLELDQKKALQVIKETYPNITKPGRVYNQVFRFFKQMKLNDVVMIPGVSSNTIAFGIIESDVYIKSETNDEDNCPFEKRKKVRWIKEVNRRKMDPRLYPMVRPHNTISNADQYGPYIDKTLHDFYVKGDHSHFIINVNTNENVSLQEFRDLIDGIYKTIDIVNELGISDRKFTHDDVKLKISVQSEGSVELLTHSFLLMLAIGGAIGIIFGVEFSIATAKFKTEGLKGYFDKITQQRHERKMKELEHQQTLERLAVEHAYLKERLKLQFPNEKAPSGGEEANPDHDHHTETKSE